MDWLLIMALAGSVSSSGVRFANSSMPQPLCMFRSDLRVCQYERVFLADTTIATSTGASANFTPDIPLTWLHPRH